MAILIVPLVLNRMADAAGRGPASRRGEGVSVTDTHVITHHARVPRACASPTVVARRSGGWSQATIWSTGDVPGAEASVLIPPGMTVTYDVSQMVKLRCLEVQGRLRFGNRNALLYVSDLQVLPSGSLVIGTVGQPISPDYRVEIVIRDAALQAGTKHRPGRDPEQYLTGFSVWGELTIHGAPMERTFIRLAREGRDGDAELELRHVPRGWRVGDEIVIPDSRQADPLRSSYQPAWETHVIESIEGTTLRLKNLLVYDHPGARDADPGRTPTVLRDGTWLLPHVGNLSRNVIVRSERATGTRGHVYFAGRAQIDVRYARWQDLGRTRAQPLDSSTYRKSGAVAHIGSNQRGRYAMHFHHLKGPRPEKNRGYQFVALGNVIIGGAKWGLVLHDTHFGLVQDNLIYQVDGAGLVASSGNEFDNVIQRNFVVGIRGGRSASGRFNGKGASKRDFGELGDAFWFAGPFNVVIDNVASSAVRTGFVVFPLNLKGKARRALRVPKFRGADVSRAEETTQVNMATRSLRTWLRNEVYGATSIAVELWHIGQRQTFPDAEVTVLKDQRVWHVPGVGLRFYQSQEYELHGWVQRNDPAAVRASRHARGGGRRDGSLVTFGGARAHRVYLRDFDGQGGQYGILNRGRGQAEWLVVEASSTRPVVLRNYIDVAMRPWVQRPANGRRTTILRNLVFEPWTQAVKPRFKPSPKRHFRPSSDPLLYSRRGRLPLRSLKPQPRGRFKPMPPLNPSLPKPVFGSYYIAMQWQGHVRRENVFRHEQTYIENYQNRQGEHYQVFYEEQAPGFVIPDVGRQGAYDLPQCIGLTNAACWRQHGGAIAGEVAPCLERGDPDCQHAKALAGELGIQGLALRLQTPIPQPPRPDPVLIVALPIDGQVFESNAVTVEYYAGGDKDRIEEVHLQLDNASVVTGQAADGRYTFEGVKPGRHRLRIWGISRDGTTVEGTSHHLKFDVAGAQAVAVK